MTGSPQSRRWALARLDCAPRMLADRGYARSTRPTALRGRLCFHDARSAHPLTASSRPMTRYSCLHIFRSPDLEPPRIILIPFLGATSGRGICHPVAVNCWSISEAAGDAALLLEIGRDEEIREAILRASEPAMRHELASRGRARAAGWSSDLRTARPLPSMRN